MRSGPGPAAAILAGVSHAITVASRADKPAQSLARSKPLHHQPDKAAGQRQPAHSQQTLYLPVYHTGLVQLESILDEHGVPVNIIRRRAAGSHSGSPPHPSGDSVWEHTRVVDCPTAGFDQAAPVHVCTDGLGPTFVPLDMRASGAEPLAIRWHSLASSAAGKRGPPQAGSLEGITRNEIDEAEDVITVPLHHNVTMQDVGRIDYYLDRVTDTWGNVVVYPPPATVALLPSAAILSGITTTRTIFISTPPQVALAGRSAGGQEIRLSTRKTFLEFELAATPDTSNRPVYDTLTVFLRFSPASEGQRGWTRPVEISSANGRYEVNQAGTYEIVRVQGEYCEGVVLSPSIASGPDLATPRSSQLADVL